MTIQKSIQAAEPPEPASVPEAPARVTPMMEQYLEIKAANPGLDRKSTRLNSSH